MIKTTTTKRKLLITAAVAAFGTLLALGLVACGGSASSAGADASASSSGSQASPTAAEDKTITIAATPTPHAEILNDAVAPLLEKEGYTLVVKARTGASTDLAPAVARRAVTVQAS